ncbi:organic cation transporter protein-like isoform X3 [Portunus trituberculatus]|nr:organic cation transporter protein-like isoform X3 [Portunus trituberculatus]XP_045118880.1 organic cation transporter protein-like isoform X3 [Portunus trituberculatus]
MQDKDGRQRSTSSSTPAGPLANVESEIKLMKEEMDGEDKGETPSLTCLEDIMDTVGSRGRWNVLLFLVCSFASLLNAFITMSYQFFGVTPDHWCRVDSLKEANWTDQQILNLAIPFDNKTGLHAKCHMYDYNYTKAALLGYDASLTQHYDLADQDTPRVVSCSARDFNLTQHESSVVTEWDLVCDRRVLYSTTQAANQIGYIISSVLTPLFTDRFGRRPVALCVSALALLQGLVSCSSPSIELFIILKCTLSAATFSLVTCSFLILMEVCTPSTRSTFGSLFGLAWAAGCMMLPGIAYLVRPWRSLQAALSLPNFIFLLSWRFLPESPRWLLLQDRYEDTEKLVARIAATNRTKVPSRDVLRAALTRFSHQMRSKQDQRDLDNVKEESEHKLRNKMSASLRYVLSPYSTPKLASRMCLLLMAWIFTACTYYGISLNANNIRCLPTYCYWCSWCGQAAVHRSVVCSSSVACVSLSTPPSCSPSLVVRRGEERRKEERVADDGWTIPMSAKIILLLLGKMAVAAAFQLVYLFTAELFTTQQRSLAICHCCFAGRLGSIASPYINDILGETAVWAPSAVFSLMALLSAFVSFPLPETLNKNLPETDRDLAQSEEEEDDSRNPLSSDPSV